jgi:D-alanyl-D-alanine carboxypeptidase
MLHSVIRSHSQIRLIRRFDLLKMFKKYLILIFILTLVITPASAGALFMPTSGNDLAEIAGVRAKAYIVTDAQSGAVLISKNADMPLIPASLTKVVAALVVLDTKPKMTKAVTMTQADQVAGMCKQRGVCIKSKAGVKFTVDGLFHATLILSANNAANALARSTGLSAEEFAKRMNAKAKSLGATSSHFYEPTGLDPANVITATDYSKIITAAFSNKYLSQMAGMSQYALRSTNNSGYNQTIKNTNQLLKNPDVRVLGAKTGFLDESRYNFSALIHYKSGSKLAIVVLGEDHLYTAYAETARLASLAEESRFLASLGGIPNILGTSTLLTIKN